MKYQAAIDGSDGEEWKEEIKNKHNCMLKNEVFEAVERSELPNGAKFINSTWACKKKQWIPVWQIELPRIQTSGRSTL